MRKNQRRAEEMDLRNRQIEDTLRHMDQQVGNIDLLIADLLRDIDLEELKCKERIDLVIKLMSQQARVLILRQSCAGEKVGSREEELVASLMRRMRGEGHEADDSTEGE